MSKYYLVPESNILMVERGRAKIGLAKEKEWASVVSSLPADQALRESASGIVAMLKELHSVTIKKGRVAIADDWTSDASARELVKNLADDGPLAPASAKFLDRLREVAGASAPEAISDPNSP